ncbi:hypothetical protein, partial [uncultured Tateyamaria sp.]|uniref:hypothetical protein n=1 Tax=uncultured Tateyamaria sp. TaxID=455651 RepID=UPI0026091583
TGRTDDCTDQPSQPQKSLAMQEPSTEAIRFIVKRCGAVSPDRTFAATAKSDGQRACTLRDEATFRCNGANGRFV